MRAPRSTVLLVSMSLLAAACGSTVQIDGGDATAAGPLPGDQGQLVADDGLSLSPEATAGTSTEGTATDGGFPTTGTGQPGRFAGTAEPTTTATTPGAGTQPGPADQERTPTSQTAATGRTGIGVTDDEIVVGVAILDDNAPGNAELLGIEGVTTGDTERYYEIIRDDINARGGIAGRQVRYSIYRYTTAEGAQISQLEQAACAHWTQDDPAFTVAFSTSENFLGCAEDAGQVTYASTLTASDERIFREYPHHLETSSMGLTRQQPNLVAALEAQGYYEDGYQLGVVMWDEPRFVRAYEESLVPALEASGREATTDARIKYLESNADLGQVSAQVQSTVLRFKTLGITHVKIIESNALLAFLFMTSAENQDYRPRYGLTSQNGNTALAALVPEGQLDGAVGIGWIPSFDVPASERPQTEAARGCLDRFAAAGEEPANDNNAAVMLSICERMFFTKAAIEAGLPDITNDSFVRGAESLGDSFPSYTSFGNLFGPQRHDGAYLYRHVAYDPGCVCFHYTSDVMSDAR